MQKEFVTYEIALKLKELGFDEISRFGQETSLYTKERKHTFYANYGFMGSGLSGGYIYAPLYQQVIDWLFSKNLLYLYDPRKNKVELEKEVLECLKKLEYIE